MGWIEAYVVWEGALDEEREFPLDGTGLDAWADEVISEARAKGDEAEVYIIAHDHEPFADGEDVCVQYLTDHSPYRSTS